MKAMAIDRFGCPEELTLHDVPMPSARAGQVLVRIAYAGTNPVDYKMRDGSSAWVSSFTTADFPFIPGREFSGTIVAVGDDVDGLAVGAHVFGVSDAGSYAEYIAVPADNVAVLPAGTDLRTAAGTALAGLTAWIAVHDLGKVTADDVVLIHGGGGGVGHIAVQLACAKGAQVWATASSRHHESLTRWGAHHIDYATQDFTQIMPKPTVIIDGVYFGTYERSIEMLAPGDRLVVLPSLADLGPAQAKGLDVAIPRMQPSRERLDALAAALGSGALEVIVGDCLPLTQAPEAHRILESGHAAGKVLLQVGS